jgi:hypothetical protein
LDNSSARRAWSIAFCTGCIVAFSWVPSARAQGITLNPGCGLNTTHFILSAGGWPTCSGSNCGNWTLTVNISGPGGNQDVYIGPHGGFSVDLYYVCNPFTGACATQNLGPGVYTVTVDGYHECGGCSRYACRQTTLTIVGPGGTSDPWATDQHITTDGDGRRRMNLKFDPAGACDVAPCEQIYLIQSVRTSWLNAAGDTFCLTNSDLNLGYTPEALQRQEDILVPAPNCRMLDEQPSADDPYRNGKDSGSDEGSAGRQGPNPGPSTTSDAPFLNVRSGAAKMLAEFEVDAYCGQGKSKGTWMGKTFWIYEHAAGDLLGSVRRDPRYGADLGPPTSEFLQAFNLFVTERGFNAPEPPSPPKGGIKCP